MATPTDARGLTDASGVAEEPLPDEIPRDDLGHLRGNRAKLVDLDGSGEKSLVLQGTRGRLG